MTKHWSPDLFIKAWNFACFVHKDQKMPGSDVPYTNHIGSVVMEIVSALSRGSRVENPDLAVQCAILHDSIEDTPTTFNQVRDEFGPDVADGVAALSKNPDLPTKSEQMFDSLKRIKSQPREVWMVKMADRISNLQGPPHYWTLEKIRGYCAEAVRIHADLHTANEILGRRLLEKIEDYKKSHCQPGSS